MATPYSEEVVYDVLLELYHNSVANHTLTTDITRIEIERLGATFDLLYETLEDVVEEIERLKFEH
jgi:hypothetical protein